MCFYFLLAFFITKRFVSTRLKQVSSQPSLTNDRYLDLWVWDRDDFFVEDSRKLQYIIIYENIKFNENTHYWSNWEKQQNI